MVSIIVVTGSTSKLLQRCLDSIFAQDYSDFEVLIMDNSVCGMASDICKKYADSYSKIKKFELNSISNSDAKNIGLDIASGDYVFFINGSDYIDKNTISSMVSAIEKSDSDICICGTNIAPVSNDYYCNAIANETLSQADLLSKLFDNKNMLYTKSENKLYKKSLFEKLRFNGDFISADELIAHEIFLKTSKAICLQEKYYITDKTYDISDKSFYTKENIHIAFVYYYRYKQLKKHNPTVAKEMRSLSYHFVACTLRNWYHNIHILGYEKQYKKIIAKLIRAFGLNPRGLKLFAIYKKIELDERKVINAWLKDLKTKADKIQKKHSKIIFILATPVHGNLGDQAIVFAEKYFISQHGYSPEQILEISNDDYLKYHDLIKTIVRQQDIIVIDGGGNMGTLWPSEDEKISTIISEYPNNPIKIFPQTMYYDDTDFGTERLHKNRKIYKSATDLHILLRDKRSFDFAVANFKDVKFTFTPDIVLCIDNLVPNSKRSGVLFCFREDLEKNIDDEQINEIESYFKNKSIECNKTSTLVDYEVTQYTRNEELIKKWDEFSSSRLVVTDRLHAMIFAAITGTPCIAFDNISKKVSGVHEWIADLSYIKCVDKISDFYKFAIELYNTENGKFELSDKIKNCFENFLD